MPKWVNYPPESVTDWHSGLIVQLRARRKALGLSQRDVAQLMGHEARTMLSNWETGRYIPRTVLLVHWASVLGLRLGLQELGEEG